MGDYCDIPVPTVKPTSTTRPTQSSTDPTVPGTEEEEGMSTAGKVVAGLVVGGILLGVLIGCFFAARSRWRKRSGHGAWERVAPNEYELELLVRDLTFFCPVFFFFFLFV